MTRLQFITVALLLPLVSFVSCANDKPPIEKPPIEKPSTDPETPQASVLVDAKATENTKALYLNLKQSAKTGIIYGQQEAYYENKTKEYQQNCNISDATGEYPLMTGLDIECLTNDDYSEDNWRYKRVENMAEIVKQCHKRGVFTSFSWHFREPFYGDHFYVKDMDKNDPNTSKKAFKSILKGGVNHTYYKEKLLLIANFFKSLKDENGEPIPVIFRPWHEFGGKWFWWGVPYYATSEEYIQNWRFTVDFLKNECQVHNLIYAFTPGFDTEAEYLASYPGDDYVDILGFDSYTSKAISTEAGFNTELKETISQLNIISSLATKRNKVAAFTEFGLRLDDLTTTVDNIFTRFYGATIKQSNGNIAYMMTWYNADKTYTPTDERFSEYKADYTSFVKSDKIYMKGEITSPLK